MITYEPKTLITSAALNDIELEKALPGGRWYEDVMDGVIHRDYQVPEEHRLRVAHLEGGPYDNLYVVLDEPAVEYLDGRLVCGDGTPSPNWTNCTDQIVVQGQDGAADTYYLMEEYNWFVHEGDTVELPRIGGPYDGDLQRIVAKDEHARFWVEDADGDYAGDYAREDDRLIWKGKRS